MRLLTFSFLKNCKLKRFCLGMPRMYSVETELLRPPNKGDPSLVQISPSWPEDVETELRAAVLEDMQVFPHYMAPHEEDAMMQELEPTLKRMRYEFDHWDNAIHGFRETERSAWGEVSERVLRRVRASAFPSARDVTPLPSARDVTPLPSARDVTPLPSARDVTPLPSARDVTPLPHAHVLDLAAAGYIKPHVDAVRFCGDVIAGLCLLSDAVMRLRHTTHDHLVLDALLPRRGLYIMRGKARYEFTHEVLGGDASTWRHAPVRRARRVAVICRAAPPPPHGAAPPPQHGAAPPHPHDTLPDPAVG